VLGWGAFGYGGSVLVQNVGLERTSVTHAALIIGAGPVLVALIAALWQRAYARPVAWSGFALSLAGVGFIAGGRGGGASGVGDGLVLAATLLSAAMTVAQGDLLADRDPVAVTAIQFAAAAAATLPFALATEGVPAAPAGLAPVLAILALTALGTVVPFTLFAYGQRHIAAELAGAFLNLEPLVGAVAGVLFFANPAGPRQLAGGAAIVAGIVLSSLPLLPGRHRPGDARAREARPITAPQPQVAH
jgi:drug/metabolite transporter (DMT)-like permease